LAVPPRDCHVDYRPVALTDGDHDGTAAAARAVTLTAPRGVREYADPFARTGRRRRYAHASWTSPPVEPGFVFGELVPTWHAQTPGPSWVEVAGRTRSARDGAWSRWLVLARWADDDASLHPTSVPAPSGGDGRVAIDTLLTPAGADAWQLRVTLLGDPDGSAGPVLTYAAAMASRRPRVPRRPDPAGPYAGHLLDVRPLSQRVHSGHYPEWGGGGDAWCSPTSVAMVLAFWDTGPDRDAMAWVPADYPDRSVYHVVRHCWDYAYAGGGNWSFNAAYAARFGLRAFVTRLRGLAEAEAFLAAGIPLVASIAVRPGELAGAEYASDGHLVVIVGTTESGDVVVNDPGARHPETVRRTYRRSDFLRAWLRGSGGIVYVIHPPAIAVPAAPDERNW
jgi:hypothetical protein